MRSINTFRAWIEGGYAVTVHCSAPDCQHQGPLDLVAAAARLGDDFVTVGDPNPLVARLRCSKCGGKDLSLIVSPPSAPGTGHGHTLS